MIVGMCGLAGSGKDTAADFMVKNDEFVKVAFADPLKRICKDVFDFTDEQLWGPSACRNAPDERYLRREVTNEFGDFVKNEYLTPRYALQQLGTEWGRDCYPNVWAEYAIRVARELLGPEPYRYSAKGGLERMQADILQPKGVVISDVRFMNEIRCIKAAGGKVVRLLRGQGLEGAAGQHRSEQELQSIPLETFDYVIDNREMTLDYFEGFMHDFVQTKILGPAK